MVTNSAQLNELDELDCFSFMDPTTFYGVPPTFSVQPAGAPTYSLRPRQVNPAERGASLSATSSEESLRRSQREKIPRISGEEAEKLRRSARERRMRVVSGVVPLTVPADPAPRKRTLSVSILQNGAREAQSAAKKQKMDGKKAVRPCPSVIFFSHTNRSDY
jgi:hypothetical protein